MHDLPPLIVLGCNYKCKEKCDACHDISMMAYALEYISILNIKDVHYRCVIWGMCRTDSINRLNNTELHHEIYFRDIYSGVNGKSYRQSWKGLMS